MYRQKAYSSLYAPMTTLSVLYLWIRVGLNHQKNGGVHENVTLTQQDITQQCNPGPDYLVLLVLLLVFICVCHENSRVYDEIKKAYVLEDGPSE